MFCDAHKEYLVPGIYEDNITPSEPEDNMPVHEILDERESVRTNENPKSSEFTYQKKDTKINTSAYDRVFNTLNKINTSYSPIMPRMNEPVI